MELIKILTSLTSFSNWLLPRPCACCRFVSHNTNLSLCAYCYKNLPWLKDVCYQCGRSIIDEDFSIVCSKCSLSPPIYTRLCALFKYQRPLTKLIGALKFGEQIQHADLFATLLLEAIINDWYVNEILPQLIIPVPLHPKRHKQRGYNQVIEVCKPIAKHLKIPIAYDVCSRIKSTPPQAQLAKVQRYNNMQNVFEVHRSLVEYDKIVIVDDVITTGSTINGLCHALSKAGANNIEVWCICRA